MQLPQGDATKNERKATFAFFSAQPTLDKEAKALFSSYFAKESEAERAEYKLRAAPQFSSKIRKPLALTMKQAPLKNLDRIMPGLYLGRQPTLKMLSQEIKTENIRSIYSIQYPFETQGQSHHVVLPKHWRERGIHQVYLPTKDHKPLENLALASRITQQLANSIEQNLAATTSASRYHILVHCKSGKGRSAALVCAAISLLYLQNKLDTATKTVIDTHLKKGAQATETSSVVHAVHHYILTKRRVSLKKRTEEVATIVDLANTERTKDTGDILFLETFINSSAFIEARLYAASLPLDASSMKAYYEWITSMMNDPSGAIYALFCAAQLSLTEIQARIATAAPLSPTENNLRNYAKDPKRYRAASGLALFADASPRHAFFIRGLFDAMKTAAKKVESHQLNSCYTFYLNQVSSTVPVAEEKPITLPTVSPTGIFVDDLFASDAYKSLEKIISGKTAYKSSQPQQLALEQFKSNVSHNVNEWIRDLALATEFTVETIDPQPDTLNFIVNHNKTAQSHLLDKALHGFAKKLHEMATITHRESSKARSYRTFHHTDDASSNTCHLRPIGK